MIKRGFGFTLIELLVVISIIGVLAGLVLVSYSSSEKQARDTQRKSDLKQYQAALESFAVAHDGLFPSPGTSAVVNLSSLCSSVLLSKYASACPTDPNEGEFQFYGFWSVDTSSNAGDPINTGYALYINGGLEYDNTQTFVICSNGSSGVTPNSPDGVKAICSILP